MQQRKLLKFIRRLLKNHELFIDHYPEDIKTKKGRSNCVNNVLRECASILTDLSHHLTVEKDMTTAEVQDTFMVLFTTACEIMDKYNERDLDWYQKESERLLELLNMEDNEDEV